MDKETCIKIVSLIIASKSFGRSDTYANMLKYLVERTLDNNIPKETTIANDVFGNENFDPSDSTLIRVYAYNLRKKLNKYYENEGVDDDIVLKIPKGGYKVIFINKSKKAKLFNRPIRSLTVITIIPLVVIPLIFNFNQIKNSKTLLWQDLLDNERTKMLVIGDLFIYNEIDSTEGTIKTIRDASVNSIEEFETKVLPKAKKRANLVPLSYAFLIRNTTNWVKDITNAFNQVEKDFIIRTMSRFNPKELSDNDLIVVGMLKTFGIFKDYLSNEGYHINDDSFEHFNKITNEKHEYSPSGDADAYHTDYAILLKVPGPNNNNIYLFGGIWDTGASESLNYFTDFNRATYLEKSMIDTFGEIPKYFSILLQVSGVDRMQLQSKIIHINQIIE